MPLGPNINNLKLTQPEFIVQVTEACSVVPPVSEKLHFTTLTSNKHLHKQVKEYYFLLLLLFLLLHFADTY